jgi:hypothetical protein
MANLLMGLIPQLGQSCKKSIRIRLKAKRWINNLMDAYTQESAFEKP